MRFKDKVVLITGAGAGIGKAAAVLFAKEGALIAVANATYRSKDEMMAMFEDKSRFLYLKGDVSNTDDVKAIIDAIVEKFNRIDILVNCAGVVIPGTLETTTEADFDKTMAINVKGTFLMSKYTVEHMLKNNGGVVVNISSSVAIKGVPDRIAYTASKGAVVSMTRAMASEYMRKNIRFNCICPGTTYTPSLQHRINAFEDPEKALVDFIARQPMGRLGDAYEIAEAILFAADDKVSFMNGTVLAIDGGMTV